MAGKFSKAVREKIWVKVLLAGPSGSGKTYSALRLATGYARKAGTKVAAIDTENGRIRYYANEFEFEDMQLTAPYTPEKYIEAIQAAVSEGFGVLIIDSITHEWDYCLDVHNKMPGNSYTNWAKVTPRHDAFMEEVLQSKIAIFNTVRGKDEYTMEEKNGKQVPKKVGLGYKQRNDVEYNYTVTFNIDQQSHIADATKDNTHIFEGRYEVLTERDGEALYDWANSSKVEPKPIPRGIEEDPLPPEPSSTGELDVTIAQIDVVAKAAGEKLGKPAIATIIKKYHTSANYKSIKDTDVAQSLLKELKEYANE